MGVFDERQQPDDAGAAIVKATGIYPPAAMRKCSIAARRLSMRGARANEPRGVIGRSGTPIAEPEAARHAPSRSTR